MRSPMQDPRKKPAAAAQAARVPTIGRPRRLTHEQIAVRAHEIYEHSGREHGRDVEFWLEAERQLRENLDA